MPVIELTHEDRTCLLDPVVDPRWLHLIERSDESGIFHHPLWLGLLRRAYRYPMHAVCMRDDAGELVAGLPIATVRSRLTGERLVSVPFSDLCGPIARTEQSREELLAAVDAERRRLGLSLEVHAEVASLPGSGASERFYHHAVELGDGVEAVLRRVRQPKRRAAARARWLGVTVSPRVDKRAIEAFFR